MASLIILSLDYSPSCSVMVILRRAFDLAAAAHFTNDRPSGPPRVFAKSLAKTGFALDRYDAHHAVHPIAIWR
jgi:hypothetical protein